TGSWILDGGALRSGVLNLTEGSNLTPGDDSFAVLQEMTVNGNLVLDHRSLIIRDGLSLNGALSLGTNASVRFFNTQTITNGTIEFAGALQGSGLPQATIED